MKSKRIFVASALIALASSSVYAAPPSAGEDLPLRPNFLSPAAADATDLKAAIAQAVESSKILTDAHRLNAKDPQSAPAMIADLFFTLAELHFDSGRFDDAAKDLASAKTWTDLDADYAARMKDCVERFTAELDRQGKADKTLAEHPADPDANETLGLSLLCRSAKLADAAPFLAKSSKAELRDLAAALNDDNGTPLGSLKIASYAAGALPLVPEMDRVTLCYLIRREVQSVVADARASKSDKELAMPLMAKIEKPLGGFKPPPDNVNPHRIQFFGLEIHGSRVVYILDHSGSMLDNFDFLRREAIRSVGALKTPQRFNVIMTSEVVALVFSEMQSPTDEVKKDFSKEMARFRAQGSCDDILAPYNEAFEKAFAAKPDTIIFLTDGHFDPALAQRVENLNREKKVRVNTVAFVNREPTYEEQLKVMAEKNGGTYKFVSEKDLTR